MSSGLRLFIGTSVIALIGAIALALLLQPQQPNFAGDRGYQEQPAGYRAGGSSCEPAKVRSLPIRLRQSKADSCAEAEEQHREATNNLIEARRAAIATEAGAIYTAIQARIEAFGAGLGFLTLIAAIAAAAFARKAAVHTGESVEEARRIGEAQTRAYLSVGKCKVLYANGKPRVRPTIANSGQSPAMNVNWTALVSHFVSEPKRLRETEVNGEYAMFECDIPAHGEHEMLPSDSQDFGFDADEIAVLKAGKPLSIEVLVRARGTDVFGSRVSADAAFIEIFTTFPTNNSWVQFDRGSIIRDLAEAQ